MDTWKNKYYSWISVILVSLLVLSIQSCERPGVFNHTEPEPVTSIPEVNSDEVIIHLKIKGGPEGFDHDLFVLNNRVLMIYDNYPDNGSLNKVLTQIEMNDLRSLFSENNFFSLQNELAASDAGKNILYEVTFKQDDLVHTIIADYNTASVRARIIIDALLLHFTNLRSSLKIELITDKTEITTARFLRLVMKVENQSDSELELVYTQGRAVDYVVYQINDNQFNTLEPDNELWRWSLNFSVNPVEKRLKIAAHQFTEFEEITWNVQTDEKTMVKGWVAVVGELVSTPGGRSPTIPIKIN
ncbi:MAG: hypothetical protein DWQ05_12295 [Calditrichaeota bacterium]|nr:MAG: hypothetical protein DWQ05_12295 [Calditrichota bacterium]